MVVAPEDRCFDINNFPVLVIVSSFSYAPGPGLIFIVVASSNLFIFTWIQGLRSHSVLYITQIALVVICTWSNN